MTRYRIILLIVVVSLAVACTSKRDTAVYEIKLKEKELFGDTSMVPDLQKAGEMFSLYTAFARNFPDDSLAPNCLFKAADIAAGMHRDQEAIGLYEEILTKHADNRKAGSALFMQAFVYENNLHDAEHAKAKYAEFIARFPGHPFQPAAQASLQQLEAGMSNEELIRMFQQKSDSTGRQ